MGCGTVVRRRAAGLRRAGRRGVEGAGGALLLRFYDADEQIELWGKHLAEELPQIYTRKSAAVVVFVSADYAARDWTRLERRAAFSEAVRKAGVHVLPAWFDDSELPGLLPDLVAIDLRRYTPRKFADLVVAKLRVGEVDPRRLGVHTTIYVPEPRILRVGQWVYALAISPDGTLLATTGNRRRVRMWDLRTGGMVWEQQVGGWLTEVWAVAFSPDGTRLATDGNKTVRIWDASPI